MMTLSKSDVIILRSDTGFGGKSLPFVVKFALEFCSETTVLLHGDVITSGTALLILLEET